MIRPRLIFPIVLSLVSASALLAGCGGTARTQKVTTTEQDRIETMQRAFEHFVNGTIYEEEGDLVRALEAYRSALGFDPESDEIKYSLANVYYQLKEYESARDVARNIQDKDADSYSLLGDCYRYLGDDSLAVENYRQALELDPESGNDHYYIATAFKRLGMLDSTAYHLEQVNRLAPHFTRAFNELAELYRNIGDCENAVSKYNELIEMNPANPRTYLLLAGTYEKCEDPDSAIAVLRQLNEKFPGNAMYLDQLMRLYLRAGLLDSAITAGEEMLRVNPDDAQGAKLLGQLYQAAGETEKAKEAFETYIELTPDDAEGYFLLGRVQLGDSSYAEAAQSFNQTIALADTMVDGWIYLAFTYMDWDSTARAFEVLEEALGHVTDQSGIFFLMGTSNYRLRRMEDAELAFRNVLQLRPDDTETKVLLAEVLDYLGKQDEAIPLLEEVIAADSTNATALNNLGYMLTNMDTRLQEAFDLISRALEAEPDNGAFVDSYAWILFKLGRYEEALEQMERALQLVENDPVLLDHMGEILEALGRPDEAREYWRKALELDPDNAELKAKLDR